MSRLPPIDAQAVPALGNDAHLPAVPTENLGAGALQRRFDKPPVWTPEFAGDALLLDRAMTPASVLIPLVQRAGGLQLLLTRRTEHLRDHAGQISFPGGRAEVADADAVATALRETEEEIGLQQSHVEVIGTLPPYTTVTAFVVTPVVALIQPDFTLALDSFEVAEAFEVPLAFLMNPAHHQHHELVDIAGRQRRFLSMPWEGLGADGQHRRYFIWGATAAMLRNFYCFLIA